MSSVLQTFLRLVDRPNPPCLDISFVERWPEGELDRCIATGLLRLCTPARYLPCRCCGEIEEVVILEDCLTRQRHAYTPCGEGGPVPIPLMQLQRWEIDFHDFLDAVFVEVDLTGDREELVRDRIWRLGKSKWAGVFWNVFFACGLQQREAWEMLNQVGFTARSLVFVPAYLPAEDARFEAAPIIIKLSEVISWEGTKIRFDHAYVEAILADKLASLAKQSEGKQPLPKRGSRAALIEALTRELKEHLRGARDFALTTLARTGTAKLLPRPTREFLARKLCVHKSTISRCFEDATARELRFLWELAADLERIMDHAGGHT